LCSCFAFCSEGAGLLSSPAPERAGPLLTKRTRLRPRRRAAEHQQLSDGGRKDVADAGAMLRGATGGAGAAGMNTTGNLIGGCKASGARKLLTNVIREWLHASFRVRLVPVEAPANFYEMICVMRVFADEV